MKGESAEMQRLLRGLQIMRLPQSRPLSIRLAALIPMLQRWGAVHNLSAILDPPSVVDLHLLDSLTALPFISGERVLDVGSGAGFPGVPLAIAMPDREFTLIDGRLKRVRFLRHVATALELHNVEVVHSRVEQYEPAVKFDTLVTRAFSTLSEFAARSGPHCTAGGRLVAMKGTDPAEEILDLDPGIATHVETCRVRIPGRPDLRRHIVVMSPISGVQSHRTHPSGVRH